MTTPTCCSIAAKAEGHPTTTVYSQWLTQVVSDHTLGRHPQSLMPLGVAWQPAQCAAYRQAPAQPSQVSTRLLAAPWC